MLLDSPMSRFRILSFFVVTALLALTDVSPASDYHGIRVIAHRGAGHEFDENTVVACQQSYERGIRGFEVDIRLTSDNQLVLMHDSDVSRSTGGSGQIEKLTLAEIEKLRTKNNGVPVPTVAALFQYFRDKPDVMLLLEMKTSEQKLYPDERIETYCRLLAEAVRGTLPRGTYWFTSFDRRSLASIKRLVPDAPTGLLTSGAPTPGLIEEAKQLGCGRLSVSLDATPRKLAREIRKAGLELSLWPIATVEDADLAVAFGANIICTDIPSQLVTKKAATP
jgi:glycerophosphoryl diester phosphodiesterase